MVFCTRFLFPRTSNKISLAAVTINEFLSTLIMFVKNNSKQSAEISRLCILKEARTRYIDIDPTNGIKEKKSLRGCAPHPPQRDPRNLCLHLG